MNEPSPDCPTCEDFNARCQYCELEDYARETERLADEARDKLHTTLARLIYGRSIYILQETRIHEGRALQSANVVASMGLDASPTFAPKSDYLPTFNTRLQRDASSFARYVAKRVWLRDKSLPNLD